MLVVLLCIYYALREPVEVIAGQLRHQTASPAKGIPASSALDGAGTGEYRLCTALTGLHCRGATVAIVPN